MKRGYLAATLAGLGAGVVFFGALAAFFAVAVKGEGAIEPGGGIALIRIEGVISGTDDDGFTGGGGIVAPETVINQLHDAVDDDEIAAILLRVNSPGGTAAASEEIFSEVREVNRKKPVVVSISDIGASGAYYISSGASKIIASPASEVGSIGTIIQIPNLSGLFKKLGIDLQTVTQGKYKDLGNPNRPLTPEERRILTDQSKVIYDRFIADVAKGRKMKVSQIRKIANGLTYPGIEAIELGLVDELGNFQDAIDVAAELGKIEGEPEIIEMEEDPFEEFFGQLFGTGLGVEKVLRYLGNAAVAPTIR